MTIWKNPQPIEVLNDWSKNTINELLDIRITEVGDDFLKGTMPVDSRTHQPMGILHGGASVVLAETLGSIAAQLAAEKGHMCVGLDINANHLRRVTKGLVTGTAKAIHVGSSTQVWDIRLHDEQDQAVCISRLTVAVLKPR